MIHLDEHYMHAQIEELYEQSHMTLVPHVTQ